LITSAAPVVFVIVILEAEVFATCTGLALVVKSLATHAYVEVLVNAGEMPDITALLLARVAIPPITLAVPPVAALAHVAAPVVAPQK
jgi:hypothetical protein